MKVYLDYIFIQNFIIDYILVLETGYLAKRKTKPKRYAFASLIAAIYVVIMMCFKVKELDYLISKILLAFVIIYISFKPTRVIDYFKLVGLFILASCVNVGTITVISNLIKKNNLYFWEEITIYLVGFLLSKTYISKMWKVYKSEIKKDDLIYDVKLIINNKEYKYKGLLDTGNSVYSHVQDIPIIFAYKKNINDKDLKNMDMFYIETVTLSKKSSKEAYIFDNIEILKGNNKWNVKAGVVFEDTNFSKNNEYDMILNYILYTEKMGGIKI